MLSVNVNRKLSPIDAAVIASAVYDVENSSRVQGAFKDTVISKSFDIKNTSDRFSGKSGAFVCKVESGFAFMAMGTGQFSGHALLACRGTAGLHDGLTDANAGIQITAKGHAVHAGFQRTFNCFRPEISRWMAHHRPKVVHCIGHSLGGALANLCASYIISRSEGARVKLYTFGAPRVGTHGFAQHLSLDQKLGVANIHRVYHSGDPVSQVPLWPFVHAPQPGGECYIGKMLCWNPTQHFMDNYITSIGKATSWECLRKPHPNITEHWQEWLTSDKLFAFNGLNFYNIAMMTKALSILTKNTLTTGWVAGGFTVVAGGTILDHLSYLLDKSARVNEENKTLISCVLKRALAMCGIKVQENFSITRQFIRYVLDKLHAAIYRVANISLMMGQTMGLR